MLKHAINLSAQKRNDLLFASRLKKIIFLAAALSLIFITNQSLAQTVTLLASKQVLSTPMDTQIRFSATVDSISVHWNDIPDEVTQYEITLTRNGAVQRTQLRNLAEANFTTFAGLSAATTYKISIVSSGDRTRYASSASYEADIRTDSSNQFERPLLRLSSTSMIGIIDILVAWDAIDGAIGYRATLFRGNTTLRTVNVSGTTVKFGALSEGTVLLPRTLYRVEVITIGSRNDSAAGTATIRTDYLGTLDQVEASAFLTRSATNILIRWDIVQNASRYDVNIYEVSGESLTLLRTLPIVAPSTGTETIVEPSKRYRVGIVVQGENYRASDEFVIDATPFPPIRIDDLSNLLIINRLANNIIVGWNSSHFNINSDLYENVDFVLSITDVNGQSVVAEREVPSANRRYESSNSLSADTAYILNYFSRIEVNGVNVDSSTVSVPFRTRTVLTTPTTEQITFNITPDSAEVTWNNDPSTGADTYIIRIFPDPQTSVNTRRVSARRSGTTRFALNRDLTYSISITATGNSSFYIESLPYTIPLELNRGDEIRPVVSPNININVESIVMVNNKATVTLIWQAATDLAGSFTAGNGSLVNNRTRPNNDNISYELTIIDITLGAITSAIQRIQTGILTPQDNDSTVVLFDFSPNFEIGRVYEVRITAVDGAGLRSEGAYSGTYPSVSLPAVPNESIIVQERAGTSITLSWRSAIESIGEENIGPSSFIGYNNNLIYRLTITDISDNVQYLQDTTDIEQVIETGVLLSQANNNVSFTLDRSNSVLIPGRSYTARINPVNSLLQASTETYTGTFGMAASMDTNSDGIEDSLAGINGINDINRYCGSNSNPDIDDDGISNLREVATGTDCRPASLAGFNDNGLTLDGVRAPMLTLYRIGRNTFDAIADIYTAARPIAIAGFAEIANNAFATTICSDCTLTSLLVVADTTACTRLSNSLTGDNAVIETDIVIDNGDVGNVLCQVRNNDNIYVPLGFSTIVWKLEDFSGNVIQERQLYYVAPEISISPARAYVQRNADDVLNEATVKLNINVGQIGGLANRYDSRFDGTNIEGIDASKFLLNNNIIMPRFIGMETNNGAVASEYRYAVTGNLGASTLTATLSLDTADVVAIEDTLSPENYQIDRGNPATYGYKIESTTQTLTVVDSPIEVQVNSRLNVSDKESKIVISVTTATDTRGGHTVSADVLYKVNGNEGIMPLVAQNNNNNTTTFDLILITEAVLETSTARIINEIAVSESSATRIYITSNEDGAVIWERYCAYSPGTNGFCNIASQQSPAVATSATLTASSISYRPDGRYSASLVPASNTAPTEAAIGSVNFAGAYSSFPVIEFNADTISRGQLTPTIALVIKLLEPMPNTGGYLYKYIDRTLGNQNNPRWHAFFEGEGHGRLYSATQDAQGDCPAIVSPDDTFAGLTRADGTWSDLVDTNTQEVLWYRTVTTTQTMTSEGVMEERLTFNMEVPNARCILLWITDGGRNDADVVVSNEVPNGIISDPIRFGAPALPPRPCPGLDSVCSDTTSNGGAVSKSLLFLLLFIVGVALIQRRKKIARL